MFENRVRNPPYTAKHLEHNLSITIADFESNLKTIKEQKKNENASVRKNANFGAKPQIRQRDPTPKLNCIKFSTKPL